MPSGAYLLSGHDGPYAVERFRCGPADGGGWRYDAIRQDPSTGAALGRIELHLEDDVVRLHAEAGSWVLRGAAADGRARWRRGDREHAVAADGFTGTSPAHLVVISRLAPGRLRLVELTEPVLATRSVLQSWAAGVATEADGVGVVSFQVDHLETGERGAVHLADDVVVDAPGLRLVELQLD